MDQLVPWSTGFWTAVLQVAALDLLLGADNAMVIALASRNLPEATRRRGVILGTAGAIALRVLLTTFALALLGIPLLKLLGAGLLLWIGVRLMLPDAAQDARHVGRVGSLLGPVGAIIAADALMSLDNVLAIAAASRGRIEFVVLGLAISIPIIVGASRLVLRLIERFQVILVLGGGLLGWVAIDLALRDPAVTDLVAAHVGESARLAPLAGAAAVMAVGVLLARRRVHQSDRRP